MFFAVGKKITASMSKNRERFNAFLQMFLPQAKTLQLLGVSISQKKFFYNQAQNKYFFVDFMSK